MCLHRKFAVNIEPAVAGLSLGLEVTMEVSLW